MIQTPSWPWQMVGTDLWYDVYDDKSKNKIKLQTCLSCLGFYLGILKRNELFFHSDLCLTLYILFVNLGTCL